MGLTLNAIRHNAKSVRLEAIVEEV